MIERPMERLSTAEPKSTSDTAVVLHLFHLDVWRRISKSLKRLDAEFDLHITINPDLFSQCGEEISVDFPAATVHVLPNRGMDILPFLKIVPHLIEQGYTQVLKIHTKKGKSGHGQPWGEVMTDSLISDSDSFKSVQEEFRRFPGLSIAGPAELYVSGRRLMLQNERKVTALADYLTPGAELPEDWGFFAGTMFWSRPDLWSALSAWAEENPEFFDGNYALDGLWVHAIERVFGLLAATEDSAVGLLHHQSGGAGRYLQVQQASDVMISYATSEQLVEQYAHLKEDLSLFKAARLLDEEGYAHFLRESAWSDEDVQKVDISRHFLLIGQFDEGVKYSLAWAKRQQNTRIPWSGYRRQPRVKGLTSIIVPVYNNLELTRRCVESVAQYTKRGTYQVILVDNGSEPETEEGLQQLAETHRSVRVVRVDENQFFALGSNLGFKYAKGEYCVFLNNDTEVSEGWLPPLLTPLRDGHAFATQPQLLFPDGTTQCLGVAFSEKADLGYPPYQHMVPGQLYPERPREFRAITAACMAVRAQDFARVKGFDPIYVNGQEDVDLCLRLCRKTGKSALSVPESSVVHYESKTPGRHRFTTTNRRIFVHRWKGRVVPDDVPMYERDGFEVADWEPEGKIKDPRISIYRPVLKKVRLDAVPHSASVLMRGNVVFETANKAFKEERYSTALHLYEYARREYPDMRNSAETNILLTRKRLKAIAALPISEGAPE